VELPATSVFAYFFSNPWLLGALVLSLLLQCRTDGRRHDYGAAAVGVCRSFRAFADAARAAAPEYRAQK